MVMESLQDSDCQSLSDSFSLYERYMRSFSVVNTFLTDSHSNQQVKSVNTNNEQLENITNRGNIDLSLVMQTSNFGKHQSAEIEYNLLNPAVSESTTEKCQFSDVDIVKIDSPYNLHAVSSLDQSSTTAENSLRDEKSDPVDLPSSSDDSKPGRFKPPIFITSTMENSNNAVDSVPMFSENVFKLPIRELSFNGTLKHVQKLKPIVDPLSALSSHNSFVLNEKSMDRSLDNGSVSNNATDNGCDLKSNIDYPPCSMFDDQSSHDRNTVSKGAVSTSGVLYDEYNCRHDCPVPEEISGSKWNMEQSYSSLDASFDSGVRSPDVFSDEDDELAMSEGDTFWNFLKDVEDFDKKRVKKSELLLQGVLPPPSITILKVDVSQMLKKYYCNLPAFTGEDNKTDPLESNSVTPTKRVSFVHIPTELCNQSQNSENMSSHISLQDNLMYSSKSENLENSKNCLKMCSQAEATDTAWPELLKCRYYDVHYNITKYTEKFESLAQRYGERYVGAETDTSICIHSGGFQSPSSASKRKALRLAQAKSPGRRLSHLARRRQTFCSAATINEKAQSSLSKMVLIDKNFFPHRKLITTSDKKSPRKVLRRTPGKKTPIRKTPGKKTPNKTPKSRSGGSSRKKSMRRLLMDSDAGTKIKPTVQSSRRELFVSPEGKNNIPTLSCSSVPAQNMKYKRALFGSPAKDETKSCDSDQFLKRKRDELGDLPETSRSKIAKSLSFGGGTMGSSQLHSFSRRASEVVMTKHMSDMNNIHKQKLLWAVSVALRAHGWSMSTAGFREKAGALARLTRRLLALPPHAAKLAHPRLSTSDTMLKLARQYVFAIIQGRTVEDCLEEEKAKLANEGNNKISGYISASAYQALKAKQASCTLTSGIKENTCSNSSTKQEQPRSNSKNILQDKLVNIDTNSNSSSGLNSMDKNISLFKSNSMPTFEEAAKMRARRQITFDNLDFSKR